MLPITSEINRAWNSYVQKFQSCRRDSEIEITPHTHPTLPDHQTRVRGKKIIEALAIGVISVTTPFRKVICMGEIPFIQGKRCYLGEGKITDLCRSGQKRRRSGRVFFSEREGKGRYVEIEANLDHSSSLIKPLPGSRYKIDNTRVQTEKVSQKP